MQSAAAIVQTRMLAAGTPTASLPGPFDRYALNDIATLLQPTFECKIIYGSGFELHITSRSGYGVLRSNGFAFLAAYSKGDHRVRDSGGSSTQSRATCIKSNEEKRLSRWLARHRYMRPAFINAWNLAS